MEANFVLGFLFDKELNRVLLIRKNRPSFMFHKLNGIGGKIEVSDRNSVDAMIREAKEEVGYISKSNSWEFIGNYSGAEQSYSIDIFYSILDLSTLKNLKAQTDEDIFLFDISSNYKSSEFVEFCYPILILILDSIYNDSKPFHLVH